MAVAGAAVAVRQEGLLRGRRKRQRKAVQDPRWGLGERVGDRRKRSLQEGLCFMPIRRSADRRRHAGPEDRAGNMRTRGACRSRRFTPNGFHFRQTRPLADRADRIVLRGVALCRLALGFGGGFYRARFPGPAIGSSISFCPAAAFFGFLGPGFVPTDAERPRYRGRRAARAAPPFRAWIAWSGCFGLVPKSSSSSAPLVANER